MAQSRTPMEAMIVEVPPRRGGYGPDDGEATTLDAILDLFGSEEWTLVVEVTAPDGQTGLLRVEVYDASHPASLVNGGGT